MTLLIGLLVVVLCAVATAGSTGNSMATIAEVAGNRELGGEFRTGGCLLMILVAAIGLLLVGAIVAIGGGV